LSIFGQKLGFKKDELGSAYSFLKETPFDYKRKYRASLYENAELGFLAVAGAPEKVVKLCSKILMDGEEKILSAEAAEELKMIFHKMLSDGLRVLAVAMKSNLKLKNKNLDSILGAPEGLTFVGFCGIKDDIRPQVRESVERLKNAGIKTVMITGDHRLTAHAIARETGIWNEGDEILNGDEIEEMSEKGLVLRLAPGRVSVFARVTPENKLKIIKAYKESGEIVAMTGDGVNDAPPLVAADLGVAMGKIGTEVAKEASDIVLLDDNLGSIVSAVEEGRSIYKTIKKVILYLFSTGVGEAFTISVAIFFGWPLPILAGQIIWLNLVTDGFLDMALAMEPKEDGLLSGNFKRSKKYLVDSLMLRRIAVMAVPMAVGALFLFNKYARGVDANMVKAWTISLTTLAAFQWFNAWNCRSEEKSIFHLSPYSNKFLVGATLTVVFLQMFALNNPFMQKVLRVVPLSVSEWAMILSVAFSIVIIEEARKFIYRRRKFLV
ncbi:HAD-IC family P-type ATPase, partial [Patescibacteria group bacterium]|nr:HAD-IC family P-type ATPase [Patescibacteria group bacterium]